MHHSTPTQILCAISFRFRWATGSRWNALSRVCDIKLCQLRCAFFALAGPCSSEAHPNGYNPYPTRLVGERIVQHSDHFTPPCYTNMYPLVPSGMYRGYVQVLMQLWCASASILRKEYIMQLQWEFFDNSYCNV